MASIDLTDAYGSVEQKIKAQRTYLEIQKDAAKLKKDLKNNLEQSKKKTSTSINKIKEKKKRYQREVKTQMDQMLSMVQFNSGSGSATMNYIKGKFVEAAVRIGPKIYDILLKESITSLGCSQQQAYDGTQTLYIKVKSTDLQNLLKRDPNEESAAVAYEKTPPTPNTTPYSMNREMWERLQNLNVPVSYYGASGNKLFEISYVQSNGVITGDFYKIKLENRPTGVNKVGDFLNDYYKSINIVDTNNLFAQLMDLITGAVSFEAKLGYGELAEMNKFMLILQRILGLCFDNTQEIDVGGNSKVAELDGIDESFFEMTDIDLRYIDSKISNVQKGVMEFEDCDNVILPVDTQEILNSLLKFNDLNNITEEEALANSLVNVVTENPKWPNSLDIKLSMDLSFLKDLPRAIMMALLSPKVLLPIFIMSKAIGQNVVDAVESFTDFIKTFAKYTINLMSKIGGLFIQELFEIIKKDITTLVSQILSDIVREKVLKKYTIILKLVELILIIARFVSDWRKCKSVVDEILALLNLVTNSIGGAGIPAPLLAACQLLDGYSPSRAMINTINEFQKVGLPTGPMPDGSPNLMLQSIFANLKGQELEENQNGKVQIFVKPLAVTPAGLTAPAGDIYGKKL